MQNTGLQHLSRLSDAHLLEVTASLVRQRDAQTAVIVTHLAAVAARQAFRALGYSSLYRYCVHELHLSEQSAYKHVWAVRLAQRCPAVLAFIADGRVHLAGVCELARHVTRENASELLEASVRKTRREIQEMLAERIPKPDLPTLVMAVPESTSSRQAQPTSIEATELVAEVMPVSCKPSPGKVSLGEEFSDTASTGVSIELTPRSASRVEPISPSRYAVQVTVSRHAHELLRRAQDLLAHANPGCDVAEVLEIALEGLVERLEKRKFANTVAARPSRGGGDTRHVPAAVRRKVAERDGKRCTFESDAGKRCEETALLEFDHLIPVARGGRSTVDNVRLRCRAHNQFAAEQVFGAGFMREKRERAQCSARHTKARAF